MPTVANVFDVPAPRGKVWSLLIDSEHYASWNPKLVRVDGIFVAGSAVTLNFALQRWWMPDQIPVDVDICEHNRELRWSGPRNSGRHMLRASHGYLLEDTERSDVCRVTHSETFRGPLATLVWPLLGPAVVDGHQRVNAAMTSYFE